MVLANAPDLDFAAGLAAGAINAFHGGITHSFGAAVAVAGLAGFAGRRAGMTWWRLSLVAFALYASHVLLDMACNDSPRNPGMPVLWPATTSRWLFSWRPLRGISHGGSTGGVPDFLEEFLSAGNLVAVAIELAVFLPLLGLVLWVRFRLRPHPAPAS